MLVRHVNHSLLKCVRLCAGVCLTAWLAGCGVEQKTIVETKLFSYPRSVVRGSNLFIELGYFKGNNEIFNTLDVLVKRKRNNDYEISIIAERHLDYSPLIGTMRTEADLGPTTQRRTYSIRINGPEGMNKAIRCTTSVVSADSFADSAEIAVYGLDGSSVDLHDSTYVLVAEDNHTNSTVHDTIGPLKMDEEPLPIMIQRSGEKADYYFFAGFNDYTNELDPVQNDCWVIRSFENGRVMYFIE